MMKIAGVVAAVVVLATGWPAHSDPLSLQRACAQQAREQFKLLGYDQNDEAEFENHYNAGLNKCLMVLKNYCDTKDAGYYSRCVSKNLIDDFEGKEYGEYLWCSDKEKKYWEQPPVVCYVKLPSGEATTCHSEPEFEGLSE